MQSAEREDEMLTYEAWRISYQDSEQAARVAYAEMLRQHAENIRIKGALIRARQSLMASEAPFYEGMKILNDADIAPIIPQPTPEKRSW